MRVTMRAPSPKAMYQPALGVRMLFKTDTEVPRLRRRANSCPHVHNPAPYRPLGAFKTAKKL